MAWEPDWKVEYADLLETQAKMKAEFCLRLGVAPSEYDNLTQLEIEAFIEEFNRQAREKGRRG